MSRGLLVLTLSILVGLALPIGGQAQKAHVFNCSDCHRPGTNPRLMTNLCTACHDGSVNGGPGQFDVANASNALGHNLAATSEYPADQTSHIWGGSSATQPSAGATLPPTSLYFSRYGISTNRVTCSICHNPHNEVGTKLVRATLVDDLLCQKCHTGFYHDYDYGYLTHPVGSTVDYQLVQSLNPTKYKSATVDASGKMSTNVDSASISLVNGKVSCTSCHATHFADSNSDTTDGVENFTSLLVGDGHQLKADGPTRADKSVLCQTCHSYKEHGKMLDGGENVGCLVCHSGHVYGTSNLFVLRGTVTTATFGSKNISYATTNTLWNDNVAVNATGYCEKCHGSPETILKGTQYHKVDEDCRLCHKHNMSVYSFQNDTSVAGCGDCHGFPPYKNIRGDRLTDIAYDGGYAYRTATHNYAQDTAGFKNESLTPHNTHAAGGIPVQGAATDYSYGIGMEACNPCHLNLDIAPSHNEAGDPGSYRNLSWNQIATGNGVFTGASAPGYNNSTWVCTNNYCHSNGGRRNASGTKSLSDFNSPITTPTWNQGKGTIVGKTTPTHECAYCHGNSAAKMAGGEKNNSLSHQKHLGAGSFAKTYSCNVCHRDTATSNTAIASGSQMVRLGGKHVNGTADVVFNTTFNLGYALLGTATYTNGTPKPGTCTVYCHSNGRPPYTALVTPDWDDTATGACGTCHGITAATLSTGSHAIHIDGSKAKIKCSSCHGANSDNGTHGGHIDGAFTKLSDAASCDLCHGVENTAAWDVTPTWGNKDSIDCRTCHTGAVLTSYVNTSSATINVTAGNRLAKTNADTKGHGLPSASKYTMTQVDGANKTCTACHMTIKDFGIAYGGGHVDGIGNNKVLLGSFSCESCHTAAGSRSGEATVRVKTHSNQTPGYTKKAYNAAFTKACLACHDPHGTSNGAMIETLKSVQNPKDTNGNFYNGDVSFTSLTLNNSFDEADAANNDDLCATCHATPLHNNRAATGTHSSYEGTNCTVSCHKHNSDKGGFMASAGTSCGFCHDFPPNTGAHGDGGTTVAIHAWTSSLDKDIEDRTDCEYCHPGAASYTYDTGIDQGNGLNHGLAAGRLTKLNQQVGYQKDNVTKKWYCASACHLSDTNDGFWWIWDDVVEPTKEPELRTGTDTLLSCNSCHYWNDPPSGVGNATNGRSEAVSATHNKHFDSGKNCITCHPNNSTDNSVPHIHIDNHDSWVLNNTNDGSVLEDRANATLDEAMVVVPTWNGSTNNCANAACHNPSGLTKSATWGTPNGVGCDFCHSNINPDADKVTPGSHGEHMDAATNFGISTVACTSCHPNNTVNAHLNGAVNLNGGFAYSTSLTDYTSSSYGRCTTTTCHNNGRGTAVQTPVWGASSANCTICHAAPPTMANNRHAEHVANTGYVANPNACGKCHLQASATQITATTHIDGTRNVGSQITDMDLVTGGNQLIAPGGWNGTCTNTCHLVDTTGTWTDAAANKLGCLECHASGKIGSAPASGLHVGPLTVSANPHDDSFKVTRNEATPSGTCVTCHSGINLVSDLPATHYAGGAAAPAQAALATDIYYAGGSPSTCAPKVGMVNCHDDRGGWSRKWSATARDDATPNNECGNCHGDFDSGWAAGVALRHNDPQVAGSHDGTDKCYMCHTYKAGATVPYNPATHHRNLVIEINANMLFADNGAIGTVRCDGCHDSIGEGLADGDHAFQDTYNGDVDSGLNRWGRNATLDGPDGDCNSCHVQEGRTHTTALSQENANVHNYHSGSPLTPGCDACHSHKGGVAPHSGDHFDGEVDFGGTYMAASYTYNVAGYPTVNCNTTTCHNSSNNAWRDDSVSCAECHAATTKVLYLNEGLRGWPVVSDAHTAHRNNDAYVGATPTSDCDACHGAGASTRTHAEHSDNRLSVTGAPGVVASGEITAYSIIALGGNGTCTNNCHTVVSGRDWNDATTLACLDCHQNVGDIGKDIKNNTSGLHQTSRALAHDDSFPRPNAAPNGSCTSCHTTINLATLSHVDGVTIDPNTAFGLFTSYDTANSTCSGGGVADRCHSDGGDWTRKWNLAEDAKPQASDDPATSAVCGNCHGTFYAGWNSLSASHTDPDPDNTGDEMQAGGHLVCEKCHGWGNANYNKNWLGTSNSNYDGHGDGHITMNGPVSIGTGYNPATGGCATVNCHGATPLTMNYNSGWPVNYGDFGGAGACGACHDDGAIPPNSGAHVAHGADADADYSECEACHGTNNGGDWATGSGGNHNTNSTVDFAAGITYSNGGTPGTNAAAANDSCTTTQCHSAAGNPATWGTPASLGCNACHYYQPVPTKDNNANNANALSATHGVHFDKGKVCIDCHGTLPTSRTHIVAKAGSDGAILTLKANAAQNDADPVSRSGMGFDDGLNTCSGGGIGLGCHNTKSTPPWGSTGIGCIACHVPGGGAAYDPASGLHNMNAPGVQKHNDNLTGGCTACHAPLTGDPTTHIDGTWEDDANDNISRDQQPRFLARSGLSYAEGAVNNSTCFDDGTVGLNYNAGTGCHRDDGVWKRLWSTEANVDMSLLANQDPGLPVCNVCHGQYQTSPASNKGWREGTVHYLSGGSADEDKGGSHNKLSGVANKCKDCHAYYAGSVTYHQNGALNFSGTGVATSPNYALAGTTSLYCAECHNDNSAEVATDSDSHTFLPTAVSIFSGPVYVGGPPPEGSCTTCHGNPTTGQYWPDGSVSNNPNQSYAWADSQVGSHNVHIDVIAAWMDGNKSTPGSLADKNATCSSCHPNPGGGVHMNDSGDQRVDLFQNGEYIYMVTRLANGSGRFNYDTDGTCSTIKCHARAPYTPGWHGDTTAPGNVTLHAEAGPVPRSIRLYWDAPGDDGFIDGTAYKYDIRMGETSGEATNFDPSPLATNYVKGIPTVHRKGDTLDPLDNQETIIHDLDPAKTYYFSLRTYDEAGHYGGTVGSYVSSAPSSDTVPPVLTGSPKWYGIDSVTALDDGTVKLSWTRAEDHSMPITYDIWWKAGDIDMDVDPPNASYKSTTSIRASGLTGGESYKFSVRAKDKYGNRDINTADLTAVTKMLATVPLTSRVYYANGTATANIPMLTTNHTVDGNTTALPAVFIGPTAFNKDTNLFVNGFSINVDNGAVASTLRAELGYITGTNTWNSFSPQVYATDQVIAKKAIRLVNFRFNGVQKLMTGTWNGKVGVKISVSGGTVVDNIGWGPTSKGGIFTCSEQPVNLSPATPTVSTSLSGANVNIWWSACADITDGVADSVHYDVYGSANDGSDGYPYVLATGLTTNATSGAPLVWNTQDSGVGLDGAANVRIRVEAGDSLNGKTFTHSIGTTGVGAISVNNFGDNIAPGAIANFKAETRPKLGSVYLTWTAPGDDGVDNGRAYAYDIRWSTTGVIDNDTKFNAATQLVSEPYPDFGGIGQGYEVLDLPVGSYYFAIKAIDEKGKISPLAYTDLSKAAGPKCGICHATPPNELGTRGNHAKHGYTIEECGNCHGDAAKTFTPDHQDGDVLLGWKTATPTAGAVDVNNRITYTQGGLTIYQDSSGGGFNVELDDETGDKIDNGTCFNWSTLGVSGCHGPAGTDPDGAGGPLPLYPAPDWNAAATLVCSACHGDSGRAVDNYDHSFDDASEDISASPPVDNHGYIGNEATEGRRKYVGAHVAHLNYSFRLSKGDSCRMCHGASRPGYALHANGKIDVKLDLAAAGPDADWFEGIDDQGPDLNTAGSCGSMSPEACHPYTAQPKWDSNVNFDCTNCHGFNGFSPSHITDPNKNIDVDNDPNVTVDPLVEQMPGNCTWCHVGGHPNEKDLVSITNASPAVVTTANAHNLATGDKITIHTSKGMTEINNKTFSVTVLDATSFSLQGSNSTSYGVFDGGTWIEGNGTGIILLPNDNRVGINYKSGGIHIKANIGSRGEKSSEAELCWGCHGPNGISEWGADNSLYNGPANNTATRDAEVGNGSYNFGTLTATPNGPGNWINATWQSGTAAFGYKTQTIKSTHSTDPSGTVTLTGSGPYGYTGGGVDTVGKIHCSNCHDVHNSTNSPMEADGLNPDGPPYLRGTWMSNPYKEDGAPMTGTSYTAAATPQLGYGYGAVPRGSNSTSQQMGGYWIDQNSGSPTVTWNYNSSAALCQLCHGTDVNGLDTAQGGTENLWITGVNGHRNSALGGAGSGGANIFYNGVGGRQGTGGAAVNPNPGAWMGFQNSIALTSNNYAYGPRSGREVYLAPLATANIQTGGLLFAWGVTVDAATTEGGYHQFSCSKCHNPHASRLPKLMITNCLDVSHNTWDNSYDNENGTKWTSFQTTASSWGTQKISHLSTAQNCHRYIDLPPADNVPEEKGWNKVTPW